MDVLVVSDIAYRVAPVELAATDIFKMLLDLKPSDSFLVSVMLLLPGISVDTLDFIEQCRLLQMLRQQAEGIVVLVSEVHRVGHLVLLRRLVQVRRQVHRNFVRLRIVHDPAVLQFVVLNRVTGWYRTLLVLDVVVTLCLFFDSPLSVLAEAIGSCLVEYLLFSRVVVHEGVP
jgi:hypothetical protein